MMNFSEQTIRQFKELVFDRDVEVCGNLRKESISSNDIKLYSIREGIGIEYSPGKFRGSCSHEKTTSVIFHTHPVSFYAYPSPEDIVNVIKNYRRVVRSIIATKWGLWDIKNTDRSNIYSSSCRDVLLMFLKRNLDKLWYRTRSSVEGTSRDITLEDIDFINGVVDRIEKVLHLEINLYTWDEVENGVVLKK